MVADLQNTKAKPRYSIIDMLKCIGIILVVFGHFIEPFRELNSVVNNSFIAIYFFHMPLFCFLSGLVAKFKLKNISRIGVIYVFSQAIFLIFSYFPNFTGLKSLVYALIIPFWHLWYLYAMLFWLTSISVVDIIKKRVPRIVIVCIVFIVALGSGFFEIFDKYALTRVIAFYPFFLTGYLYKEDFFAFLNKLNNVKSKRIEIMATSMFVFIIVIIMLFADKVNSTSLWNGQAYSAGGYTLIERSIFYLISSLLTLLLVGMFFKFKNQFLEYIGKNTLLIYIFHGFIFWMLRHFGVVEWLVEQENMLYVSIFSVSVTFVCVFVFSSGKINKFFNVLFDLPIKLLFRKNNIRE